MGTIQARFRVLLARRIERNMMVFLVHHRMIAVEFVCDSHTAAFNVVVEKSFQ